MRAPALIATAAILAIGCGPGSSAIEGDAGPPGACTFECFPGGFRCRGGVIVEVPRVTVPCDTTSVCPDGEPVHTCERGCVEDAMSSSSDDLCNETRPKNEGDPCEIDADCEPSATSTPLACDPLLRVCVPPRAEACNGFDDDFDDTIDESCECSPRVVASLEMSSADFPLDAAFGPDRIALVRFVPAAAAARSGSLHLLDASGAPVAEIDELAHVSSITRDDGEFRLLLHAALGRSTVLRLHDDGTEERVALDRTAPGSPAFVYGDDAGWTMLSMVNGRLAMTRHAPTGARTAMRLTTEPGNVLFVAPHAGAHVFGLDARIMEASATLELTERASVPAFPFRADALPLADGRTRLLLEETVALAHLVTLHPDGSLEEHGTMRLGSNEEPKRAAIDPATERLAVAWRDASSVHVELFDARSITPTHQVVLRAQPFTTYAIGHVGTGFRVVVGHQDDPASPAWTIFDPCPSPAE
ncbi:hypothetical protein [Sandaracinus amylolyticus]|uniref:hypothetical protein n=1 Tax=Sandaracinus amylolyticus TaxID=927083 RepID=UPI001F29A0CA|nr:hypothetical protein [Sandaracinus amylolyticus]UJR82731.1 Hypothetical protein I5071_47960 [Sandaracinus amylolyticus]